MSIYSECGHPAYGNHCPKCAKEAGAAEERAKIVAWLRSKDTYDFDDLAIDIEVGEHLK